MEASSGLRPARRWRLLLAHDASAPACEALPDAIVDALGNVDIVDASSVDDARVTLHGGRFDVCLVCLDLPPAPTAGVRLASEVLAQGLPVVLVTRSQRWIPWDAPELRALPWIAPDAAPADVADAIGAAVAARGVGDTWDTSPPLSADADAEHVLALGPSSRDASGRESMVG